MAETFVQVAFDLPLDKEFTYRYSSESIPPNLDQIVPGLRVKAPFGRTEKEGIVTAVVDTLPPEVVEVKSIAKVIDKESLLGPWTIETARWMSKQYFCSFGEALFAMLPSARRERELPQGVEDTEPADHDLELSDEQKSAIDAIEASSDVLFYLKGITGSGKTEVFLQAANKVLLRGQQVLYLVPEIALTWQLTQTLKTRFGNQVAILHSHLTPAQKLKEWRRIRTQEANLVVGARSAVFAPLSDPGLIVIDEEHENGYKSGSTPRYHARQVALFLTNKTGAKLVMGSATPSLEALSLMRDGRLKTLQLTKRLSGGSPPSISVVSLRGQESSLSPALIEKIHETHALGRQSILFLNRRGFSSTFHCKTCGEELKCKNCSVSMTWHKARGVLLCHYCGWQTKPVQTCPVCGSLDVHWQTVGTEHIEDEIKSLFPQLVIARLDSDTSEIKGHTEKTLDDFGKGRIDLLLGTQMVAKGLNFPGLKLVGILNADLGLSLPDFRASERVFALIRQVAGRAGRFKSDGEVVLQTVRPDHSVIRWAAEGKEEEFWTQELALRKMLNFPPYCRLIRFVFRSSDKAKSWSAACAYSESLKEIFRPYPDVVEILGPAECALGMISNNYRNQILLRSSDFPRMHFGVTKLWNRRLTFSGVYVEIDVDPLNML